MPPCTTQLSYTPLYRFATELSALEIKQVQIPTLDSVDLSPPQLHILVNAAVEYLQKLLFKLSSVLVDLLGVAGFMFQYVLYN